MNISHLQYFIALADNGHLTETAKNLYISQPTLTSAVKSLEKELGVALFARNGRQLILTDSGRIFYRYASHALASLADGAALAKHSSCALESVLRIGHEHYVRKEYLQTLLNVTVLDEHPETEINLTIDTKKALIQKLKDGELDAFFTTSPVDDHGILCTCKGNYDLVAVVSKYSPIAQLEKITTVQLAKSELITYHPQIPFAERAQQVLRDHSLFVDGSYEDDESLYLAAGANKDLVALARFQSSIKHFHQVVAIPIVDIERNLFGTYLNAKHAPYRTDLVKEFICRSAAFSLPDIERMQST